MLLVHLARTVVSKEGCDLVLHNVEREAVQRHLRPARLRLEHFAQVLDPHTNLGILPRGKGGGEESVCE